MTQRTTTNGVIRAGRVGLCGLAALGFGRGVARATDFEPLAYRADAAISQGVAVCGLETVDAYDARLPRPQVYADRSYVNWERGYVAGSVYRDPGDQLQYRFPNGHVLGTTQVYQDGIEFGTDVAGTVAFGSSYLTPSGRGYNLYCRSRPVDENGFLDCIQRNYVDTTVARLCAY
jgi:hypothetical protein